MELTTAVNEQLREDLARATRTLAHQHQLLAAATATHAQLGRAQDRLAAQRRELEDARNLVTQLHADATALARAVAQIYQARNWAGYAGPTKDVVERYVRTGQ